MSLHCGNVTGRKHVWALGLVLELETKVHTMVSNHREGPDRAFSRLKAPTSAFTFKTLLRHYARRALTPW